MIDCLHVFIIFWLSTSNFSKAVDKCSVHVQPPSTVVVAGETVSLNCSVTSGDFSISSWQIGTDTTNKTAVYTALRYGRNGNVTTNKYVAAGYAATNTAEHKTASLLINRIDISQSGLYICQCDDTSRSFATIAVVVLASEPKISVISSVTSGNPVSFSCNISFSGSADISSHLIIKDISGTTVNSSVCYPKNRPTSCSVEHTTIANPSVDQSYNCSVQLIANNSIIYSRSLNTHLEWKQVIGAEIVVSNPNKCSVGKCVVHMGDSIVCKPKTEGNLGMIFYKWWQIQHNGSKLEIRDGNQTLVLTKIGRFTYQCQAYDTIRGVTHNATSQPFIIEIAANDNSGASPNMLVVIGISVAIGIVIVVIAIFVACICCSKRQRSRRDFRAISTNESSVPPPQRQPTNRYDKTKVRDPDQQQSSTSTASNHPAVPNTNKAFDANELTVVENDLYGEARCASPNPVVPSAVCIPEENIYNEIGLHHNSN